MPVSGPDWEDKGSKDDGLGIGDYPNLPERSYQLRDPYAKYWDQQDRRNFGEPVCLSFYYTILIFILCRFFSIPQCFGQS